MSTQPHTHSIVGVSEAMHKLGIVTATKSYAYHDRLEPDTLDYGGYATQNRSFYLYLCMISSFIFSIAARSARARCFFNFLYGIAKPTGTQQRESRSGYFKEFSNAKEVFYK